MSSDHKLLEKYLAPGEDWDLLCQRVAGLMQYRDGREEIYDDLLNKRWLPNSPTLVNAMRPGGRNMMACHAFHVPDSVGGIFDAVKWAALIFKSGGGIGIELSELTQRGKSLAYAPQGMASGPVSFLRAFDITAQIVMEGGLRRAAMLASLNANHIDILGFISCKEEDKTLSNFNVTVTVDNGPDSVKSEVWKSLIKHAWWNGEPGIGFLDNINRTNPTVEEFGQIIALNACAELPLYNFGSCVLGSVVLPNVIESLGDLGELMHAVKHLVKFLNRVIDLNHYPLPEIAQATRRTRDIGIGVMGFATLLAREGIPYTSKDALTLAHKISLCIQSVASKESWALAKHDGGYLPNRRRNARLTAIAPTGHISRLAGVSFSIYPELADAMSMTIEEHLDMVAAWQEHVDSSISYTVNLPNDADESDVDAVYRGAYERCIKVLSVYRNESRVDQPCTIEGMCSI